MLFSEVIGQESAKERLKQMASGGRIPHALLFLGPPDGGKLSPRYRAGAIPALRQPRCSRCLWKCNQCNKAPSSSSRPALLLPAVSLKAVSDNFLANWRQIITKTLHRRQPVVCKASAPKTNRVTSRRKDASTSSKAQPEDFREQL